LGFHGTYTFADRRPVSFRQLESVRDDRPARRVNGVYLSGIAWTQSFRQELAQQGLGGPTLGFRLGGAPASGPLPWGNMELVTVEFGGAGPEPRSEDLVVFGASGLTYAVSGFTFDARTNTATWTLDRPLAAFSTAYRPTAERAVLNLGGVPLHRVDVVPGDADRSGHVSPTDFGSVRAAVGRTSTDEGAAPRNYTVWRDVNGSGGVSPTDLGVVRAYTGVSLAALQQPAAALPPASMTEEMFGPSPTP
jgi:hypothetical protein